MVIEGTLHVKGETKQISDSFTKREFVVEFTDNPLYPQYITFELAKDRCAHLDKFKVGDKLEVTFNLRGREYTKDGATKYFNSLEAWMVKEATASGATESATVQGEIQQMIDTSSDLPF